MPDFSERTGWSLEQNEISTLLKGLREENAPIIDLTESNPTRCGFQYPPEILSALQNEDNLVYEPASQGIQPAREAISTFYQKQGCECRPDDVVLTASTSEAYNYLFRLLTNPRDAVLFPRPSYPLFSFLAEINDIHLIGYELSYNDGRWEIDLDALSGQILPHTKAICLVQPNNPTGSYFSREEIQSIKDLCRRHQLALICDEVFFHYSLESDSSESLCRGDDVLTFVLSGLSKLMGLPQMKVSWIIVRGPEKERQMALKRLQILADTFLSVNTPVQQALPVWFSHFESIHRQIHQRVKSNYDFLKKEVSQQSASELLRAQGGWYALLRVPSVKDEEAWVKKLLTKYHVYVHPGFFYDFAEEPVLVISLLPQEDLFREGVGRILSRIQQQCHP